MPTHIDIQDPDSSIALAAMLSALDGEGVLEPHEEMVAQRVLEACFEDLPAEHVDLVDEQSADIAERLEAKFSE